MIKQTMVAMSLTVVVVAAIPHTALAGSGSSAFVGSLLGGALGSALSNSYYNRKREQQRPVQESTPSRKRTVYKKRRRVAPPVSSEGVRVQKALRSAGYYNGPLNGKLDSYDSRAAIMQYQARYGLLQTGVLAADAKGVLLQQADIAEISAHLLHTDDSQRDKARRLQAALKVQGFYTASIDGSVGPKSQAALRLYQQSKGMIPSGALLPEQEHQLVAASVQLLQNQQAQTEQVLIQVARRNRSFQQGTPVQTAPSQQRSMPVHQPPIQQPSRPVEQRRPMPDQQESAPVQMMAQHTPVSLNEQSLPVINNDPETRNTNVAILTDMTELKAEADVFADTLAELSAGTEITVNSIDGDWAYVSVDDQHGYVFAEFLRK